MPIMCCMSRLTPVMLTQQKKPITRGLPPVFISLTMLVLRPMALMAMTMKNLLNVLKGAKNSGESPITVDIVVITDATMNHNMKNGKIERKLTLFSVLALRPW